jgi:mannose-1-phosphate guanylyltransferase
MPEFEDDRGHDFRSVGSFLEKPPADVARALFDAGAVWNTMILVGRASTLLAQFERHLPDLVAAFAAIDDDSEDHASSLAACYERLGHADFSRDLIGKVGNLTVHTWPAAMGWSDLGTPERMHMWLEATRPVDALVRLSDLRRSGGLVAVAS